MSLGLFFDYLGVRPNAEKAADAAMTINMDFGDQGGLYLLQLENGVLNNTAGVKAENADATVTLSRSTLDGIMLGEETFRAGPEQRRPEGRWRFRQAGGAGLLPRHLPVLVQHRHALSGIEPAALVAGSSCGCFAAKSRLAERQVRPAGAPSKIDGLGEPPFRPLLARRLKPVQAPDALDPLHLEAREDHPANQTSRVPMAVGGV